MGSRLVLISERLVEAAALRPGWRILDVACGSGNAAIAAARQGAHVVGVDYVPALLEDGRTRAAAEGVDVTFHVGDAEALPAEDGSYDATTSVLGAMFAPDHQRAADEIVRVTRSGGTVALASWTPDGFVGQMFRVVASHVTPPPGVQSPLLWGTPEHLAALFGDAVEDTRSTERTFTFRYTDAEQFVAFFRRWYGPVLKAFEALDDEAGAALAADLTDLARSWDVHRDGAGIALPATYLETVLTLR